MILQISFWLAGWNISLPMQETQEMQVQSLSWEDPLEQEMATHLPGKFHGQRILVDIVHGVTTSQTWLSTHANRSLLRLKIKKLAQDQKWYNNQFSSWLSSLAWTQYIVQVNIINKNNDIFGGMNINISASKGWEYFLYNFLGTNLPSDRESRPLFHYEKLGFPWSSPSYIYRLISTIHICRVCA